MHHIYTILIKRERKFDPFFNPFLIYYFNYLSLYYINKTNQNKYLKNN